MGEWVWKQIRNNQKRFKLCKIEKSERIEREIEFAIVIADWCCLCRSAGESVSHLLLHCPIASDLWAFLFCLAGICWVMPNSVVSMLESWNGILGSRRYGTVGVTLACMMWCIWGQGWRQDLMFGGAKYGKYGNK